MDDEGRRRGKETYDLGVGFFAFFAVAFFVVSLVLQLTGGDAIWASVSALAAAAILGVIWLFRRRFLASSTRDEP